MKKRTKRTVKGARYRTFNQMANVCPLVSIHGTVWYSVRKCGCEAKDLTCAAMLGSVATFSASPSSPAARKRNFFTRSVTPAEVADATAEESVEAVLERLVGTCTGMVYETKEWIVAYRTPTRNWMICIVVRERLRDWGMGTENAVRV